MSITIPSSHEDQVRMAEMNVLLKLTNIPIIPLYGDYFVSPADLSLACSFMYKGILKMYKLIRNKKSGKFDVSLELECMILERIHANHLSKVARVQKSWRSYISNNRHKMRLFPCDYIQLGILTEPIGWYIRPNLDLICQSKFGNKIMPAKGNKLLCCSDDMFVFLPVSGLDIIPLHRVPHTEVVIEYLDSFPDWWLKENKHFLFYLTNDAIGAYISKRFNHLKTLQVTFENVELLIRFIEIAPNVDLFEFEAKGEIIGDSVLEAIIQKSIKHPTQFPFVLNKEGSLFSLSQIIRFLEHNVFPNEDDRSHPIIIFSSVSGKQKDWRNWLDRNTTNLSVKFQVRHGVVYTKYHFIFRNMYFIAEMGRFTEK